MDPSQQSLFAKLVTDVHAFYRQDCSAFVLDVWWSACQPFDFEQVSKAFTRHATDPESGKFCPKPADLVRALAGTATDRAAIAWGKVLEAMSSIGAYQDVVFDDPAIHAVIEDLGGWPKVCRTESKELGYVQHRFLEAHRAYTNKGKFEYARRLTGDRSPDDDYRKIGLRPPKPALVGFVDDCRLVYKGGNLAGKTQITFGALANLSETKLLEM